MCDSETQGHAAMPRGRATACCETNTLHADGAASSLTTADPARGGGVTGYYNYIKPYIKISRT